MATREDAGKFSLHPKQSCQSFLIYIHYWEQKINKTHHSCLEVCLLYCDVQILFGGWVGESLSQGITKFHASIKDGLLLRPCGARVSPRTHHPTGLHPARLEPNGTEIIEQGWVPARPVQALHLKSTFCKRTERRYPIAPRHFSTTNGETVWPA